MIAWIRTRYAYTGEVVERSSVPALIVCALFALVIGTGVGSGLIGYQASELNAIFLGLILLWCAGLGCQIIGLHRIGNALKGGAILFMMAATAALASAVLARISAPISDNLLNEADQMLFPGFDWQIVVTTIDKHRFSTDILNHSYASLNWQPQLLILGFAFFGNAGKLWRFLNVWALALFACITVSPLFPAAGGYVYFGIPQTTVPNVHVPAAWEAAKLLYGLKDGSISDLGLQALNGIVTMPSFHAAAAVMLGWGFWQLRLLRWPFLILNALMFVSTVPIGGHYLVDVIAGTILAITAIKLFGDKKAAYGPVPKFMVLSNIPAGWGRIGHFRSHSPSGATPPAL